jgi:ribosomal protein RSM22 (predicted rRNA methylase)
MRRVSEPILSVLSRAIGIDIQDSSVAVPLQLKQDILELSRRFTRERGRTPLRYLDDRRLGSAYLTYFYLVNLAKVQELLDELAPALYWGKDDGVTRVLDLGCGPGTGVMGALDWAVSRGLPKNHEFEYVAADRSKQALMQCEELWGDYVRRFALRASPLRLIHCDMQHGWCAALRQACGSSRYDLIIMQNVLSELFAGVSDRIQRRADVVMAALDLLSEKGTVMLIEPALRDSSRELHEVRNRLLETTACTVYSPCLHEASCPALTKPDDWCHEERQWSPPTWIQAIDREVGFIKDALKFSYVLLRKDGRTVVERDPHLYRVVSELRVMKGEKRAWLCHEGGRPEVGRLDRLASPMNEAVDDWHRGAIVRISEIVRKERKGKVSTVGRIDSDTAVQIIRPV